MIFLNKKIWEKLIFLLISDFGKKIEINRFEKVLIFENNKLYICYQEN